MAGSFVGGEIPTVGSTWQTAAGPPLAGESLQVLSALANNKDNTARTISGRKKKGLVTSHEISVTLAAGQPGQLISNCVALDATDETYEIKADAVGALSESIVDMATFKVAT